MSRLRRSTLVVLALTGTGTAAVPAVAGPSLGVLLYTSAPTPGGSPYACAGTFDPSCSPLVPEVSLSRTFDGLGAPTGSGSSSFGVLRARATMDDPTGFGGPAFFVTAVSFSRATS